jgi:UTP--glucose-1-phosphate uridylyltransferase
MKAIIPLAGLGTRMLPASKGISKEMLTMVDRPMIQHILDECIEAGIKEVTMVISRDKEIIQKYFRRDHSLENILHKKGKYHLEDALRHVCPETINLTYIYQDRPLGLGHAILCGMNQIEKGPVVVLLPDVLTESSEILKKMIQRYEKSKQSQILVQPVPWDKVSSYGIVAADHNNIINKMVEKPSLEEAPSNLSIVGRYILTDTIWDLLKKVQPGKDEEIQLTDALKELIQLEPVELFSCENGSHDCGQIDGYIKTFIKKALEDPKIKTYVQNELI